MSLNTGFSPQALGIDLEAAVLLDDQALQQVRRAGRPAVGDGQAHVRDHSPGIWTACAVTERARRANRRSARR